MQPAKILQRTEKAGVKVWMEGDKIAFWPQSKLSPELCELIKANRDDLVRYLTYQKAPADLVRYAIEAGVFEHGTQLEKDEIAAMMPPSDWNDAAGCTTEELKAWGASLAMRAIRYRGQVPADWDRVARCQQCGPVYSFHNLNVLTCGWCEMRRAGVWFPVPEC